MARKHIHIAGLTLVIGWVFACSVLGQVTTGTIRGTVIDSTGAVVPGATITVQNLDTAVKRTVTSDGQGRYAALQLPSGQYEITAGATGFETVVRSGITLFVGQEAVVDFTVKVGSVAESIVVTGEAPVVETANSTVSSLIEGSEVRGIPLNGRSFDQLVLLQPGVFLARPAAPGAPGFESYTTMYSAAGARPTQTVTLLDGTNINSFFYQAGAGVGGRNLGVDAIREFRLITSNYSAEFGNTNGAVVNIITRSGTNQLHGLAFEFLRNSALDAKNFFDIPQQPIPPFKRNQFGFSLGGPIVPDKTFFFGSYEGLRDRLGITKVAFVPNRAAHQGVLPGGTVNIAPAVAQYLALYPLSSGPEIGGGMQLYTNSAIQPSAENFVQIRIDHQISENHSVFGRYTQDRANMVSPYGDLLTELPNEKTVTSGNYMATLGWSAILSPTMLNTARLSFTRIGHRGKAPNKPDIMRFVPSYGDIGRIDIGPLSALGVGPWAGSQLTLRNSFQYSDDFIMNRGSHTLKFGASFQRFRDAWSYNYNVTPWYIFISLRDFLVNAPIEFIGSLPGGDSSAYWRQWMYGFYGQDDWKVNSRLTLNLGLRYEPVSQATNANSRFGGKFGVIADAQRDTGSTLVSNPYRNNPSLKNIAPRFGFAWDVTGDGKTAVRGGFSIAYEPMLAHLYTFTTQVPPLATPITPLFPTFPNPFAQGVPSRPIVGLDEPTDYNACCSPTTMQYNLTIQRELVSEFSFQIGYIGSLGRHLGMGRDANYAPTSIAPNGRYFVAPQNLFRRRNPNFGTLGLRYFEANAAYNALQLSVNKRFSRGFLLAANYTWSKSIDDFSGIRVAEAGGNRRQDIQNPDCRKCDRGLSDFNRTQVFNLTYSYELPMGPKRAIGGNATGVAATLLAGWEISGITTVNAGMPTSPTLLFDPVAGLWAGLVDPIRPDLKPGRSNNPVKGDPAQWFDPSAFQLAPPGYFGNVGRNTIGGPGLTNFDFSLVKNNRWGEGKNLQIRAEFFNIFNHPNFFEPNPNVFVDSSGIPLPTAGKVVSTATTSRQIQFGLKLSF